MSNEDWALLSMLISAENPYYACKGHRDWFFNQVNRFCRDVAMPFIAANCSTQLVQKDVYIQECSFHTSTNIEILRRFASIKQETVTAIIQKYIIDAKILRIEQFQLGLPPNNFLNFDSSI